MFKLVAKQRVVQKDHASHLSRTVAPIPKRGFATSGILMLQRVIGNQAVQRILQSQEQNADARLLVHTSLTFGHDFSRIPVYGPPSASSARLTVNEPGDRYEQEADRVAEQVLRIKEPIESEPSSTVSHTTDSNRGSSRHISSGGKDLNPEQENHTVTPITIHTTTRQQVNFRLRTGRFRP